MLRIQFCGQRRTWAKWQFFKVPFRAYSQGVQYSCLGSIICYDHGRQCVEPVTTEKQAQAIQDTITLETFHLTFWQAPGKIMQELKYLLGYPEHLRSQVQVMIANDTLADLLMKKYPLVHGIGTDKALYEYVISIKNEFMHKTQPLSKVLYDPKIKIENQALGVHKYVSRVQGKKLKAKNEIRIASTFKRGPEQFLRMIVVHELAHLKEKGHNKAFFKLCNYMEPTYHQLEFDMRLYLTQLDISGPLY